MKKYIKSSFNISNIPWDISSTGLYVDGEYCKISMLEKPIGDTGYVAKIEPEYIEDIDAFGWRVNIYKNGKLFSKEEFFESEYDAEDFVNYEICNRLPVSVCNKYGW